MALIRPRVINTLTANPVGYSETASCGSFLYMPIYYFHFWRIIIILLSWFCIFLFMSFAFRALLKAASESCLYKLQNAVIAGPRPKGVRDQITCFAWNALSCIYLSDTDCFGVAPARGPDGIKHINRIEVISFDIVCTKSKLNRSAGVWQEKQTLCDCKKNALPLISLCFVTLRCWNFWCQLTLYV